MTTYLQKELSQRLARTCGDGYELYSHESGTWTKAAPIARSEILHGGDWTAITEEEAFTLIADVASGAFYVNSPGGSPPTVDGGWRDPPVAVPMTGSERFVGVDGTVADFWRFAMSDFRTNNLRGYLAEYLVARAVGATQNRVEWDSYDVETPDGITIEVKSSAYLQAWAQRKPSAISFSSLRSKTWTPQTGYAKEATYNADVYVFCLQTATGHATYNPIDVNQWEFYVISNSVLADTGQSSLTLSRARSLSGGVVAYSALEAAIRAAVG